MSKTGRNDLCPCGSGLKFKRCCGSNKPTIKEALWSEKITAATRLSLEFNQGAIERSLSELRELLAEPELSPQQKVHGLLSYAAALQHQGSFASALEQLEKIAPEWVSAAAQEVAIEFNMRKASSLAYLGRHSEACNLADSLAVSLSSVRSDLKANTLLELSRVYTLGGKLNQATESCKMAMQLTADVAAQIETNARAIANLASLYLRSESEQIQKEGVALMDKAVELKLKTGDLQGLANSFNNLGNYYSRVGNYERAIASFRKDLALSRDIGDLHGLVQTNLHLADLYSHLNQTHPAARRLADAKKTAGVLNNPHLNKDIQTLETAIEARLRDALAKGERLGPHTSCKCGSGQKYEHCCGRADFEPVSLPWNLDAHSQAAEKVYTSLKQRGIQPTRLDFFLREGDVKDRRAWYRIKPHEGWHEVLELPDVANIELSVATNAAIAAERDPNSIESPLTSVLLAVCALEAFINQVAFFVAEVSKEIALSTGPLPPLLPSDPVKFQRETELTLKWHLLGTALCGSHWPVTAELLNEFKALVQLRNEFVHFKVIAYEQIVPPVKEVPAVARVLPRAVTLRESAHSWPFRVLTPSAARWAVDVATKMIEGFRGAYFKHRKTGP